jgi:predicted esterase
LEKNPLSDLPLLTSGRDRASARAVTILVHGRARTPEEMIALAARFDLPEMAFVAPTAAGGTWYPESFLAPFEKNQPHLDFALARLEEIVRALEAEGFSRNRIALVGFSQGACLLAEYVSRNAQRWGAIALLTGGYCGPENQHREKVGDFDETPIFMGIGDSDAWVPLARAKETAMFFAELGAEIDLRITPSMEHVVSDEQIRETSLMLAKLLTRQRVR